jgi:hypothetical protein
MWDEDVPELQKKLMQQLYGEDIWDGFQPLSDSVLQGWNGIHYSLDQLASTIGDGLFVDVGVWKGLSTIEMARSMRNAGMDGCILAVDTFLGSPEHWNPDGLFSRSHGMPDLYTIFLSNVVNAGLQDYVVPMPQTSVTAAMILKKFNIKARMVHIDAAHEYEEVLRDAREYWDIIEPGGWLVGDDYHKVWPGVIRAAGEFSAAMGIPMSIVFPKWLMQKTA